MKLIKRLIETYHLFEPDKERTPLQNGRGYAHAISRCAYGNAQFIIFIVDLRVKEIDLLNF